MKIRHLKHTRDAAIRHTWGARWMVLRLEAEGVHVHLLFR
jgi:hypothetical protein